MADPLLFGFDLFVPALLEPKAGGGESYAHDRDAAYLVVQPLVSGAEAVAEYLTTWSPAELAASGVRPIWDAATGNGIADPVPVPIPPGSRLQLTISWKTVDGATHAFSDDRTIGGVTTAGPVTAVDELDGGEWPSFAIFENAIPMIDQFGDLPTDERTAVREWLVQFVSEIRRVAKTATLPPNEDPRTKLWSDRIAADWANKEPAKDLILTWLATNGTDGVAHEVVLHDALVKAIDLKGRPSAAVPRFHWPRAALPGKPQLFLEGAVGRSYLHALWTQLADRLKAAKDEKGEKKVVDGVAQALGRLYGFGERLAWPAAKATSADGAKRFMLLQRSRGASTPGWVTTNAVSLLGQAFRLVPFGLGQPALQSVTVTRFDIAGQDLGKAKLEEALRALAAKLAGQAPVGLAPTLTASDLSDIPSPGATRRDRLVLWHPRVMVAPPLALTDSSGTAVPGHFAVPASLIEVVDDTPRNASDVAGSLVIPGSQRRGLRRKEIVTGFADAGTATQKYRTALRVPARLELTWAAGNDGKRGLVGRVLVAVPLLPAEKADVRDLLKKIAKGERAAHLWIQQANGTIVRYPVGNPVAGSERDDGFLLYDEGEEQKAGTLRAVLAKSPEGAAPRDQPKTWAVTLEGDTDGAAGELFDVLIEDSVKGTFELPKGDGAGPSIALSVALVSRLAMSTERLLARLALKWNVAVQVDAAANDPTIDHAGNCDKLRLKLHPKGAKDPIPMAEPDALLPLPKSSAPFPWVRRGIVDATSPHGWYWLAFHPAHTTETEGTPGSSTVAAEPLRFALWVNAGEPSDFSGYVEHQYGHRVPLTIGLGEEERRTRRAVEIVHPALTAFSEDPDPTAKPPPPTRRIPLLEAREHPDDSILVTIRRTPVARALARWNGTEKTDGDVGAALREIYEAIAELRDAIRENSTLLLEGWSFDNGARLPDPGAIDLGETQPAVAVSLVDRLVLRQSRPAPFEATVLQSPIFGELDSAFDKWRVAVEKLVAASADPDLVVLATPSIRDLSRANNLVRVGIDMLRPKDRRVDESWGDGVFAPLDHRAALATDSLATQARTELRAMLSNTSGTTSRLHRRLAFVEVAHRDAAAAAKQREVLFGENHRFLLAPSTDVDAVDQVIDVFYVLFAFLLPARHPALGDRQATADFAGWLLTIAERLRDGRSPHGDFLQLVDADPKATTAADRQEKARKQLADARLIDRIVALLARVDDVDRLSQSSGPGTQPERQLFRHVQDLVRVLDSVVKNPAAGERRWADTVRAMVQRRPTLMADARGIALGIFNAKVTAADPGDDGASCNTATFDPSLFALEVTKRLEGDDATITIDRETFDATRYERWDGVRYFVDVLPDRIYDDTFVIDANTYRGVDPNDPSQLGQRRRRGDIATDASKLLRGDLHARWAEHVIEDPTTPFAMPLDHASEIEANLVHHNPSWRVRSASSTKKPTKYLHLLPEKRVPPRPRPLVTVLDRTGQPAVRSAVSVDLSAGTTVKLYQQWKTSLTRVLGAPGVPTSALATVELPAADAQSEPRRFQRATPGSGSMPLPEWRAGGSPEGWHYLTTYLSHVWFEVDLQKLTKSFGVNVDDDVYEIEVELWNGPPQAEASEPGATPAPPIGSGSPLLDWFTWWRQAKAGRVPAAVPSAVSDQALFADLERWLVAPIAGAPWYGASILEAPAMAAKGGPPPALVRRRRYRFHRHLVDGWLVDEILAAGETKPPDELGAVLAIELLAPVAKAGEDPSIDTPITPDRPSALLRVSILDHPFQVARARARILRNWKDVDGDMVPDINPAFVLAEPFSDWFSRGREAAVVLPAQFEAAGVSPAARAVRPVPAGTDTRAWLERWQKKCETNDSETYGNALRDCIGANAFTEELPNGSHRPRGLWETDHMLGAAFTVDGSLIAVMPEIAPRQEPTGPGSEVAARRLASVRSILPRVSAAKIEQLTEAIRPREVLTFEPVLEVRWLDGDRLPVLMVQWPVRIA